MAQGNTYSCVFRRVNLVHTILFYGFGIRYRWTKVLSGSFGFPSNHRFLLRLLYFLRLVLLIVHCNPQGNRDFIGSMGTSRGNRLMGSQSAFASSPRPESYPGGAGRGP